MRQTGIPLIPERDGIPVPFRKRKTSCLLIKQWVFTGNCSRRSLILQEHQLGAILSQGGSGNDRIRFSAFYKKILTKRNRGFWKKQSHLYKPIQMMMLSDIHKTPAHHFCAARLNCRDFIHQFRDNFYWL